MADSLNVLLVDDEPDIREIGAISLGQLGGMDVRLAASGAEGLAAARDHRPDVIVLDMMMPDMNGLSTLEHLLADTALATIPVIFMTAKVQRRDLDSYLAAGAVGVISKPFDPVTLPNEVRAIVARAYEAQPS